MHLACLPGGWELSWSLDKLVSHQHILKKQNVLWNFERRYNRIIGVWRSAQKRGLVPATSPCNKSPEEFTRRDWSQGLAPRTVHTKPAFPGTSRSRDLSQKFKLVWIRGTSRKDQLVPANRLWSKNSQFTQWECDLLQGLVPSSVPTLKSGRFIFSDFQWTWT